ncbi:MAG: flavodoxin [Eubacteriaceae bacterium]
MKKIAVVYWSDTGNTEAMANYVKEGAEAAGAEVVMATPADFDESSIASLDSIAFGCPAMGEEVLEESEFEPMFDSCKDKLAGKKVGLFGSYGWGDGEWMRTWEENCQESGIQLAGDCVICNYEPDDEGAAACRELGAELAA